MTWKCKNPECGRTFPALARISIERVPTSFTSDVKRIVVERACCPYCESTDIEEVVDKK